MVSLIIKGFLSLILLILLNGCASIPKETNLIEKPVPIKIIVPAECPQPPKLNRPDLPIYSLNNTSTFEQVIKSYVATVAILEEMVNERDIALDAYNTNK